MFSWDAAKALHNLRNHGASFEEAATIFADPEALDWADTVHSRARLQSGRVLMTSVPSRWENPRWDAYCSWFTPSGGRKMSRKRSASSAPVRRAAKSARPIPDSRIDFSDIPESTDAELKRARRVGRPKSPYAKQLIAIRIDPRLLARLRRLARRRQKPYQTMIHELLERAARA